MFDDVVPKRKAFFKMSEKLYCTLMLNIIQKVLMLQAFRFQTPYKGLFDRESTASSNIDKFS